MKTKGLLDLTRDLAVSLPDIVRRLALFLWVCLWIGHDLDEETEKWEGGITDHAYTVYLCKRCGMRVEFEKEKD